MSLFAQYLQKKNQISSISQSLDIEGIFTGCEKSAFSFDPEKLIEKAKKGEKLEEPAIKVLCAKVKEIL